MAELGIITMLAKSPKKSTFTPAQMIEIYETSGRKTSTQALRITAQKLYPHILQDGHPPITCHPGSGRAFLVNGEYVRPKFMLVTNRALMIGILPDGSAVEY